VTGNDSSARPRLVFDADAPGGATPGSSAAPPARSWSGRGVRLLLAAVALMVVAAAFAEYRRAALLEARVAELTAELARARDEIAGRQRQLEAIRTSVADVRDRVAALESLASAAPGPQPPAEPAPAR
jgi:septal ring factor EnvC (AmiA/AmiB activator)